ncbi:MAG: TonB-dependent receptor plug domain-containing protein [Bdellovibrionales bacterium]|nr:TonB-dependent receptor plug domain-containing protein [Bdellovibrionales bacterium]
MNKTTLLIILIFPFFSAFATNSTSRSFTVRDLYKPLNLEEEQRLISVTIITKKDIRGCIGCDFTDILERAGVQVQRFNAQFSQSSDTDTAYVALRGVSNTQTTLLVDGIRWVNSTVSRPPWESIPIHHIEKIEIVRGPSGLGSGNVGGSINIITQKAVDCSPKTFCVDGVTQLSNKSNRGYTAYISTHFRSLDQKTGLRLGFQGDKSQDPETTSGDYKEGTFSANLDHQIGRWLIEGSTFYHDGYNNSQPTPFVKDRNFHVASLGTTYYLSPEQLFRVSLGYDKNKQFLTGSSTEYLSQSLSVQLETVYRFDFWDGEYTLTSGVASKRERVDSAPRDEYEYKQRNTRTAFTELTGNHDLIIYRVTVRADDLSGNTKEQVFTWSGAASYHIAEIVEHNIFVRGGVNKGFRDPGFDEKYNLFGNPDLGIEEAVTHEIGLRIEQKGGSSYFLDISVFETALKKPVIIPVREELDEKAYIQGVEMQAGIAFRDWDGRVNYTNVDTDNTDQLRAHEVIKHLGSIRVDRAITPDWNMGTEMVFKKWMDSSFAEDSSVFDVFLIRNVNENLEIGYTIRNLTDERYDTGFNTEGPRRTVEAYIAVRF